MRSFFKSPLFSRRTKWKVKIDSEEEIASATPLPPRKPGVCRCKITKEGRNLVICIDGTSNQFGEMNTNVIELYSMLEKGSKRQQLTWYHSGIGTYARPSFKSPAFYLQVLGHLIDLAIAWNFECTIMAAYEWLAENYEEGDRIYLFGFSRGAFQVRVLAAMIDKVGLIHKGNAMQIPFAYELYCDPESDKPSRSKTSTGSSTPSPKKSLGERFNKLLRRHKKPEIEVDVSNRVSMAQHFKNTFSQPEARVHFVGAWDTVSSIGVVRGKKMLPRTVDGMEHVCYFRHALALDERRIKFLPEYAHGGSSVPRTPPRDTSDTKSLQEPKNSIPHASDERPQTLEVWFAGTHSDIGGGNTANPDMNRSRPPLRWMVYEARSLGLRTRVFKRELLATEKIEFKESLTGIWKLFEIIPWRRLTFSTRKGRKEVTHKLHLGSSRKIQPGQKIHTSVVQGLASTYKPKARPPHSVPELWDDLRHRRNHTVWEEDDADAFVKSYVRKFVEDNSEADWITVWKLVASGDGLQAVYDEVTRFLKSETENYQTSLDNRMRLVKNAQQLFSAKASLRLRDSVEFEKFMIEISKSVNPTDQEIAWEFLSKILQFSNTTIVPSQFLKYKIKWFCLDRSNMSYDMLHKITSTEDGAWQPFHEFIVQQLLGNDDDRQWILDRSVDILESHPIGICTLDAEKERVSSIMKSGSAEYKKAIWTFLHRFTNVQRFQLEGHTNPVVSVAYSPDGTKIASASWDWTIRLWDALTGTQIGQPLLGHTRTLSCVAFSPDGARIVSGSWDSTLRIWNAATGQQIGDVLGGHTYWVLSPVFSPDGKRIVSGSRDGTLRIWEAETGKQVGQPLEGHRRAVEYVAYSPDGRYIVSGSQDRTIRIWDAETQQQSGEPLEGHQSMVSSVAFSPDGTRIVSSSGDRTIRLWDFATRKQVGHVLEGHVDSVTSVAFSPDGKCIVSASNDKTVRIWDASAGTQIGELLMGDTGRVFSVAFSPDGTQVVLGSSERKVHVWDVSLKLWDVAD